MTQNTNFVDVGSTDSLAPGTMKSIDINGQEILLARIGQDYYAVNNICTHAIGWLDMGELIETTREVECPLHSGRFSLVDGRATHEPCTEPIEVYPIHSESGRLFIDPSGSHSDRSGG